MKQAILAPALAVLQSFALAGAQGAASKPGNYRVTFENEAVRVTHVHYGPHENLAVHNHPQFPTVFVYLTDSGPVRFSHIEETPFPIVRHAVKAGTFRITPGRIEKHEVSNLGDIPTDFLRVELKQVPLGKDELSFRSSQQVDLSASCEQTAFSAAWISVEQLVAAQPGAPEALRSGKASLLAAYTAASVTSSSGPAGKLNQGDVLWLAADQSASVQATGAGPAHLLRILFEK